MSDARELHGVLPVFQTPWREDETIDVPVLEREINWLFDRGADGVVLAMVSEVLRMSLQERREIAELACAFARGRGAVVISVGAESAKVAEEYALHAEGCGASAVMATPPVSVAASDEQLLLYFRRIVRAVSIPVIVQDASGYVGRPMSVALQASILHDFGPQRVMFKPEAPPIGQKLSALRDATQGRARVFEGTGGIALLDSFRRGIVGTMPGADLIDAIVALWRALQSGDESRAYCISTVIASLISLQNSLDGFLAVEKHLLVRQGVFANEIVRGPTGYALDQETRDEVDRLFLRLVRALDDSSSGEL